ncbi:MAG: hypothetical protein R2865_04435 [Deinococcales bacterium]
MAAALINPTQVDNPWDALQATSPNTLFSYAEGYNKDLKKMLRRKQRGGGLLKSIGMR